MMFTSINWEIFLSADKTFFTSNFHKFDIAQICHIVWTIPYMFNKKNESRADTDDASKHAKAKEAVRCEPKEKIKKNERKESLLALPYV